MLAACAPIPAVHTRLRVSGVRYRDSRVSTFPTAGFAPSLNVEFESLLLALFIGCFFFFLILTQGHLLHGLCFSFLRGVGEGEGNTDMRNVHWLPPVPTTTGDRTCDLSVPESTLQPTDHTSQGSLLLLRQSQKRKERKCFMLPSSIRNTPKLF